MRIEIVDNTGIAAQALVFPPNEEYVNLRENPHFLERIASARQYLPLRNFLIAINSAGSVFTSATVTTQNQSLGDGPGGNAHEFRSQTTLVFVVSSLNFDQAQYTELAAKLEELLERDSGDDVRGVLRVSSCSFPEQNRRGFCMSIDLVARGDSAQQAELRWGLGLARVQQALLFRARALGQQIGA